MITASEDVAIVGGGFSGLMVLANLVRFADRPLNVTLIGTEPSGQGLAYSTRNPHHLLNVAAWNMGAWAEEIGDFATWLAASGKAMGPQDFAPRAVFAEYLASIRAATEKLAPQKHIRLQWLCAHAQQMQRSGDGWEVAAGDTTIHAKRVVLATGNEVKPIFPQLSHSALYQSPWAMPEAASFGDGPVAIIGAGLTMVDTLLALRDRGYAGEVIAISRHGLLPQAHRRGLVPYAFDMEALHTARTLPALVRLVRDAIREHTGAGHDWRAVVDALRPSTQRLWQKLSPRDQKRAIHRLAAIWNSHRHRMAPEIAAQVAQEISSGKLRVVASRSIQPSIKGEALELAVQRRDNTNEIIQPTAIINCTGPELNWARSAQPLLQQLLRDGHCQPHATGMGVVADADDAVGEGLYAIGSLLTGQLWETVAVPELRQQAAKIAGVLCR